MLFPSYITFVIQERGYKSLYYGADGWTLTLGLKSLAVCYCDAWSAIKRVSCNIYMVNIKTSDAILP
jgi:hypothetical protein